MSKENFTIINNCNAIYDERDVKDAIIKFSKGIIYKTKNKNKRIYIISDGYPCVVINGKHHKLHRLMWMFYNNVINIPNDCCIHHRNHNKLDASEENLECLNNSVHKSLHHKGSTHSLTEQGRQRLIASNKRKKGVSLKPYTRPYRILMPDLLKLYNDGYTQKEIAIHYKCNRKTVGERLRKLLKEEKNDK